MKKLLAVILFIPCVAFAQDRTLDDRCDGHAKYVISLLKNKYNGESLDEQLELANEWDDPAYREEVKGILKEIIYKQPTYRLEKEIVVQTLENYIGAYRGCVKFYSNP